MAPAVDDLGRVCVVLGGDLRRSAMCVGLPGSWGCEVWGLRRRGTIMLAIGIVGIVMVAIETFRSQ